MTLRELEQVFAEEAREEGRTFKSKLGYKAALFNWIAAQIDNCWLEFDERTETYTWNF